MTIPTGWRTWLLATRPKTLAAGIAPVLAGAALVLAPLREAVPASGWTDLGLCLLAAVLVQVATNFANDAGDALSGVDGAGRLGPRRACAAGLIPPPSMLAGAGLLLAAGLVVTLYLTAVAGWPVLVIGAIAAVLALAYSTGPWPLARYGLGDPLVLIWFGPVAVLGTVWVGRGGDPARWTADLPLALPVGLALGLQATAIICINNLRDRESDHRAGRQTLATILGRRRAGYYHAALHAGAVLCLAAAGLQAGDVRWAVPAGLALTGGAGLAIAVWRRTGRELNAVLARAGLVEVLTALAVVGCCW